MARTPSPAGAQSRQGSSSAADQKEARKTARGGRQKAAAPLVEKTPTSEKASEKASEKTPRRSSGKAPASVKATEKASASEKASTSEKAPRRSSAKTKASAAPAEAPSPKRPRKKQAAPEVEAPPQLPLADAPVSATPLRSPAKRGRKKTCQVCLKAATAEAHISCAKCLKACTILYINVCLLAHRAIDDYACLEWDEAHVARATAYDWKCSNCAMCTGCSGGHNAVRH